MHLSGGRAGRVGAAVDLGDLLGDFCRSLGGLGDIASDFRGDRALVFDRGSDGLGDLGDLRDGGTDLLDRADRILRRNLPAYFCSACDGVVQRVTTTVVPTDT